MNKIVVFLFNKNKDFVKKIKKKLEEQGKFAVYQAYSFNEAMEYFETDIIEPDVIIINNNKYLFEIFKQKFPNAQSFLTKTKYSKTIYSILKEFFL